jgi:fumarylpyruvate hydrolase
MGLGAAGRRARKAEISHSSALMRADCRQIQAARTMIISHSTDRAAPRQTIAAVSLTQGFAARNARASPLGRVCADQKAVLKGAMVYVIDPPKQPSVAIANSDARFPVRRIFCVGRNYADHVLEMGNDPKSEPPICFTKPADAVVENGAAIPYPTLTDNFHHEVELVVALARGGAGIEAGAALEHVWGYGVGVDLTRRDLQNQAKKAGQPWDAAKGFDHSAPLGALTPARDVGALASARIWLSVNGETKQDAHIAEMIWSVPEIIAALSRTWGLQAGDLIFTGTPMGVGPLKPGDVVTCGVDGLSELRFSISRGQATISGADTGR